MDKKDINNLFPYFKNNKRINIFLRERTKFFPHQKELNKKSTEELISILNKLDKNIISLRNCMEKHFKKILEVNSDNILKKEIVNFIIEAEMKRLCTEQKKKIEHILKNQKKITKYV